MGKNDRKFSGALTGATSGAAGGAGIGAAFGPVGAGVGAGVGGLLGGIGGYVAAEADEEMTIEEIERLRLANEITKEQYSEMMRKRRTDANAKKNMAQIGKRLNSMFSSSGVRPSFSDSLGG